MKQFKTEEKSDKEHAEFIAFRFSNGKPVQVGDYHRALDYVEANPKAAEAALIKSYESKFRPRSEKKGK